MKQYRHGDLLIMQTQIPEDVQPYSSHILAYGEATGHHHKIEPLKLTGRYLVSKARPQGGYDARQVTGAELCKQQKIDFQGGRKAPTMWIRDGILYFRCHNTTALTHQEHGTIILPPGDYQNRIQREYRRGKIQPVID